MPMAPPNTTLLQIQELELHYGSRCAVDRLSFAVQKGECFGLLGPNGAGKSSTLACLAGLLDMWQGEIQFSGNAVRPAQDLSIRKSIGLVPQDLALYEELSARENLVLFAKLAGLDSAGANAAADRGLELAGLTDRADERVDSFSGGMKRRLNLAIGDVHQPPILMLDEPTVGVDPQSRNHIFDTLETLVADGRTLIYTTHYMEEAQRLCDRILILNKGKALGCGTHEELATAEGLENASLEEVFLHMTGRSLRD
jgi:ABC-2 type transport system ATP-binding protein